MIQKVQSCFEEQKQTEAGLFCRLQHLFEIELYSWLNVPTQASAAKSCLTSPCGFVLQWYQTIILVFWGFSVSSHVYLLNYRLELAQIWRQDTDTIHDRRSYNQLLLIFVKTDLVPQHWRRLHSKIRSKQKVCDEL